MGGGMPTMVDSTHTSIMYNTGSVTQSEVRRHICCDTLPQKGGGRGGTLGPKIVS